MMKTEISSLKMAALHDIWQLAACIQDFHTMIRS